MIQAIAILCERLTIPIVPIVQCVLQAQLVPTSDQGSIGLINSAACRKGVIERTSYDVAII